MSDRVSEANWIRNLASDIASVQPAEVKREHASQVIDFHLMTIKLPSWFMPHDLALLLQFVEDELEE